MVLVIALEGLDLVSAADMVGYRITKVGLRMRLG
jgi:hypothetical protein